MANDKQVARLKEGSEVWNKWKLQQPADLVVDLSSASLENANLQGANLSGAILIGAYLSNANLAEAALNKANLKKADLSYSNLIDANLSSANLTDAKLVNSDIINANCSNACLKNADLRSADLTGTDFSYADFTMADLTKVDLTSAVLSSVDLTGANLRFANLHSTDLTDSNLNGALFIETIFSNTNLTNVTGLERSEHQGPSNLDHRTLEQSGRLPLYFLRGCGLPEPLIDYLPSLLTQSISYYSCFISYSHADKVFARRLHAQLQDRGIRCWLDEHQLLPGDDIYERVDQGIKIWDKVLLCASKHSLTSWWVDNEIDTAFRKEQQLMKQRERKVWSLIPLNLDGFMFSGDWKRGIAGQVKSRLAADFTGWESSNDKFEQAFENVIKALKADDAGREIPPTPKL